MGARVMALTPDLVARVHRAIEDPGGNERAGAPAPAFSSIGASVLRQRKEKGRPVGEPGALALSR
jgi:hypothetical protein